MNITTIIELDNSEVEELLDVTFVYAEETICENVVQTCVEGIKSNKTNEFLGMEDVMEQLFAILRANYIIEHDIEDFGFEMPTCERIKSYDCQEEIPKRLVITYTQQK